MHPKTRRLAFVVTIVALAGLLVNAPAAEARGDHQFRVHSVATYTYLNGGSQTFMADHGTLTSMDAMSIGLTRVDGVIVTLAASANTCVHVDGFPAGWQNLMLGQDVTAVSDASGTQALSIRAGHPKFRHGEPGCRLFEGAIHGDITDTMSDGTTQDLAWDRGRIDGLAPAEIRILRADDVTVVAQTTRDTEVFGASSYWRLRLGEHASILSAKQIDPTTSGVTLVALTIRVHGHRHGH
jgi:hypothetical protein